MRRLRRHPPGAYWFVTTRCTREEYRLTPDPQRADAFERRLRRALELHPGIVVLRVVQMSNHLHLVLLDGSGELSGFMRDFLGPLSKDINEIDGSSGPLFQRRYNASEILDQAALADRIAYTEMNPVLAGLVDTPEEWPGVLLGPISVAKLDATEEEAPKHESTRLYDELFALVEARVARMKDERAPRGSLGVEGVLQQSPFDRPRRPKFSRAPLCHSSSGELRRAFLERWRAFVGAYREASHWFRRGVFDVAFPAYSYRPPIPAAIAVT